MLFSIIMCTYNSGETLPYALESVLGQSCGDWELLILDNGSTDDTVDILKQYQQRDTRIRCRMRQENVGWCRGISLCLKQAEGEYMMFLGADDMLADAGVLEGVRCEIARERPDIVWTGFQYAVFEDGRYRMSREYHSPSRVYDGSDKLTELAELMRGDFYYNSVMHYVNIAFLKRNGIDFWSPFYGDCQGMTEAICRAEKMVVWDRVAYILTQNTSQTAGRVGFDYDMARQWNSVREVLPDLDKCPADELSRIAERILRNVAAMLVEIATGAELRDAWMRPVQATLPERFRKVETWISSDAFGEMMQYAGREAYAELLIGAAGVLYWSCSRFPEILHEIQSQSVWLADFAGQLLFRNERGEIDWRDNIGGEQAEILLRACMSDANPWRIGAELLLRDGVLKEMEREQITEKFNR